MDGGVACECANRAANSHGADAQGGGSIEAGRMITRLMTSEHSLREAGHKPPLSYDPSDFSFTEPSHRRKPSAFHLRCPAASEEELLKESGVISLFSFPAAETGRYDLPDLNARQVQIDDA